MNNILTVRYSPEVNREDLDRVNKLFGKFGELVETVGELGDPQFFEYKDMIGDEAFDLDIEMEENHSKLNISDRRADGVLYGSFCLDSSLSLDSRYEANAAGLRVIGGLFTMFELEVHYLDYDIPGGEYEYEDLYNPEAFFVQ